MWVLVYDYTNEENNVFRSTITRNLFTWLEVLNKLRSIMTHTNNIVTLFRRYWFRKGLFSFPCLNSNLRQVFPLTERTSVELLKNTVFLVPLHRPMYWFKRWKTSRIAITIIFVTKWFYSFVEIDWIIHHKFKTILYINTQAMDKFRRHLSSLALVSHREKWNQFPK